jgi:uncharacterized membrane protein YkoI
MKNHLFIAGALIAGVTLIHAAETTIRVTLSELPAAAQKTVHSQLGKGKVGEIDKVAEDGEVTYEVVLKKGRERTITVAEDGQLLDMEVFLNETPAGVHSAIQQRLGSGTLEGITKILDADKVKFEVEIANGGRSRTFTFDDTGKLLEMELALSETPAPVQAAIRKETTGQKLGDITEVFEDGEATYEVELNPESSSQTLTIDPKGKVISRETPIRLSDAPAPVQKAIKELSANRHLGSITKTTEDDEVTYDVELKTEGKWDTKSIAPDGKIVE